MIPFNELPEEWRTSSVMKNFAETLFAKHASLLEDLVENILITYYIPYMHNIKAINNISLQKVGCDGRVPGEIDFMFLDIQNRIIYIVDAKFTKTKFYFQSFKSDRQHYIDKYEKKLSDKISWARKHLLDRHYKIFCVNGKYGIQV